MIAEPIIPTQSVSGRMEGGKKANCKLVKIVGLNYNSTQCHERFDYAE
ncbi:hypothetical protein [Algoriphagus sp.]